MSKIKKNVGRPKKYETEEERENVRREQYKISKQNSRKRQKDLKELKINTNKRSSDYRKNLSDFFGGFEYDFFITVTIDPKKTDHFTLNSMKNYSIGVLEDLIKGDRKVRVVRYLLTLEGDKSNVHSHIYLKTISGYEQEWFSKILKKRFTKGFVHVTKEKIPIEYCFKEIRLDNLFPENTIKYNLWDFGGDFTKKPIKIKKNQKVLKK